MANLTSQDELLQLLAQFSNAQLLCLVRQIQFWEAAIALRKAKALAQACEVMGVDLDASSPGAEGETYGPIRPL